MPARGNHLDFEERLKPGEEEREADAFVVSELAAGEMKPSSAT